MGRRGGWREDILSFVFFFPHYLRFFNRQEIKFVFLQGESVLPMMVAYLILYLYLNICFLSYFPYCPFEERE